MIESDGREAMSSDTPRARLPLPPWLLGLLAEAVVALVGALALVLLYLEAGPWLWLVRLQLALFGAYYGGYTFAFYFVLTAGAMALVYHGLVRAGLRGRPMVGRVIEGFTAWWVSLPNWLGTVLVIPLLGGAALLGIGAYKLSQALTAGERTEVRVEDLEGGATVSSRWLVARGRPLQAHRIVWTKNKQVTAQTIPLVSPAWTPGTPVALLLNYEGNAAATVSVEPGSFEGTARAGGVPGLTRTSAEKQGLRLSPDAILLDVGNIPTRQDAAYTMLAIGGVALPVGLLACLVVALVRRSSK
jgi:hypothetical protein